MKDKLPLIHYNDALALIHQQAAQHVITRSEFVDLEDSSGRVCAEDVFSTENIPAFDTSAMDGFAVLSADTLKASEANPIRLSVKGSLAAGDEFSTLDTSRSHGAVAWEIMTGAGFPIGTDACVKQEDVEAKLDSKGAPEEILLKAPSEKGQNRRLAGEDFSVGSQVIHKGHLMRDEDILVLASLGILKLKVFSKLKVGIIATGKELVATNVKPVGAQIRNSTMPYLLSALRSRKVDATQLGRVGDEPNDFMALVQKSIDENYDLVLTTGAISVGKYDFVAKSLTSQGMETFFQKVAIRPGKPLLFGKLANGPFVMGLPGNPVATATGFRFFVDPLLKALAHLPAETPYRVRLVNQTRKALGATVFLKANLKKDANGELVVEANGNQKASITHPLLTSNAWIALEKEMPEEISPGTLVLAYPL